MSRYSRFDRERINKLFGTKKKIIKKPLDERTFNFLSTSDSNRNSTPFSNSNYITMQTVDRKRKYKQKLKFRCYQDEDVYGGEIVQFLKQQQLLDNDAQSTFEQIKMDVMKGVSSLREEMQLIKLSQESMIANED